MNVSVFNDFASSFTGKKINLYSPLDNTSFCNWYPELSDLEPQKKYGVCFGDKIVFNFITGKNIDNFFSSFCTQYINKYLLKQYFFENGIKKYPNKIDCINQLKYSQRFQNSYLYSTNYGIGLFCYFMHEKTTIEYSNSLSFFLKEQGVEFKNEFSEGTWVYRFLIKKDVSTHNDLLKKYLNQF